MKITQRQIISIIVCLLSVGMGAFYLYHPAIEQEARLWGGVSILAGFATIVTILITKPNLFLRSFMIIGFLIVALGQVLPILSWLYSPLITDGPGGWIGMMDRLWLFPHVVIVLGCVLNVVALIRNR